MVVRKWHLDKALFSYRGLIEVLNELTAEEVHACLDLEAGTQRRRSVLDRLISRAVRLNEIKFNQSLQEKIYGTPI